MTQGIYSPIQKFANGQKEKPITRSAMEALGFRIENSVKAELLLLLSWAWWRALFPENDYFSSLHGENGWQEYWKKSKDRIHVQIGSWTCFTFKDLEYLFPVHIGAEIKKRCCSLITIRTSKWALWMDPWITRSILILRNIFLLKKGANGVLRRQSWCAAQWPDRTSDKKYRRFKKGQLFVVCFCLWWTIVPINIARGKLRGGYTTVGAALQSGRRSF